jgi:glycine/D-amino acid oxidase-like deaminating enzyme
MSEALVDLIVIGAGPAGISAALEASARGLAVVLLDEQASPGGQIYRNVAQSDARSREVLGADYVAGLELVEALLASDVRYQPNAAVWQVTEERPCALPARWQALDDAARAAMLLIATGAIERPMPIPGWTLPGVMTAGAGSDPAQKRSHGAARPGSARRLRAACCTCWRCSTCAPEFAIEALVDTSGGRHEACSASGAFARALRWLARPAQRACNR